MSITAKVISQPEAHNSQCLIVPVLKNGTLSSAGQRVDDNCGGTLKQLLKRGDIDGTAGSALLLPHLSGVKADRVLLLGVASGKDISPAEFKKIVSKMLTALKDCRVGNATLLCEDLSVAGHSREWLVEQLASNYSEQRYQYRKTLSKPAAAPALKKLALSLTAGKSIKTAIDRGLAIGNGINVSRELGNLPANICTPSYLAKEARALARKYKSLSTTIVEEKKMHELGMHSLLSVTAGTDEPAKLIVMQYKGAAKSSKPHALVGKGVTFDSGGISIKPGARMDEMKYDMCGAASVFGTINAIAEMALPINVVAVVAAVENMPSGCATKPGDVITSMAGKTIEVLNTDAEGRLVLCDALTYVGRFKPKSVIDIATLTGACVVALGKHATGLYSNSDELAAELLAAGNSTGDRAWQMPLWDEYKAQLSSNFADLANIGGPEAGSVTAACFLSHFTEDYRWAHLDIAGSAWNSGANKGSTGRPVALLSQYLIKRSTDK